MNENQIVPPPDYDFILKDQQNDPSNNSGNAKKNGRKKLLIIAGIVLVICLVAVVVAIFAKPKKANQTTDPNQALTQQLFAPTKSPQEAVIQQYLQALEASNYEKAYSLLNQTPATIAGKTQFIQKAAPLMNELINFNNCQITTVDSQQPNDIRVTCAFPGGGRGVYTYQTVDSNGKIFVDHYETVRTEAQ